MVIVVIKYIFINVMLFRLEMVFSAQNVLNMIDTDVLVAIATRTSVSIMFMKDWFAIV